VTPALFATVFVADDPVLGRAALDEYSERNYGRPAEFVQQIQMQITGSAAEVAASLRRYVDGGAEHILLRIATLEPPSFRTQLDRLAEVVSLLRS
jgi:hypothetical protein